MISSRTLFFIPLCLGLLGLAGCAGSPPASEYSLFEIDHGMSPEEQSEWRLNQIDEMQAFVGEIVPGRNLAQDQPFRTETFDIVIENLGQVEHTIWMTENQGIVYSWEVLGDTPNGGVYFDHHGHPGKENADQFPDRFFETYATGIAREGHGVVRPGITGYHGWFFINLEERPVQVRVTISGFWDRHLEIYRAVAGETVNLVDY
jgi:hypothetical protein